MTRKEADSPNPKDVIGATKPGLAHLPPGPLYIAAQAFDDGAVKYGAFNWRGKPIKASVYHDACKRHLDCWFQGGNAAQDSGVHHLGHAVACLLILLDADQQGCLMDDRPDSNVSLDSILAGIAPRKVNADPAPPPADCRPFMSIPLPVAGSNPEAAPRARAAPSHDHLVIGDGLPEKEADTSSERAGTPAATAPARPVRSAPAKRARATEYGGGAWSALTMPQRRLVKHFERLDDSFSPEDDLALVEQLVNGSKSPEIASRMGVTVDDLTGRWNALLTREVCGSNGLITLDGQRDLLAALRYRADALARVGHDDA